MKNIYLATCFRLIAHLGGSSIATIIVLEKSPDPRFVWLQYYYTMYYFCNFVHWLIDYHDYMLSYNVCLCQIKIFFFCKCVVRSYEM